MSLCRFSSSGIREVLVQRVISSTNALAVAFIALESGAVPSVYKGMARSIMVFGFLQLSSRVKMDYGLMFTHSSKEQFPISFHTDC